MINSSYQSEVRKSEITSLLDKVRKKNYNKYLLSLRLDRIRMFAGQQIDFDFPVTALIGPNGGGKSTILGACASIYESFIPHKYFCKSRVGDDSMNNWKLEYDVIDKEIDNAGTARDTVEFYDNIWHRNEKKYKRNVEYYSINRTVPVYDNHGFILKKKLTIYGSTKGKLTVSTSEAPNMSEAIREAERVIGKQLDGFKLLEVTLSIDKYKKRNGKEYQTRQKQLLFTGSHGDNKYSEFNFGSGEASVIRMITGIEQLPESSLVIIEEIENGLHPLATLRMVEYLISAASRKRLQFIFTTHSDYALEPLPSEAIWAALDGKLQQGKLSIETLRTLSGRVDKRLAVFVEDDFAKTWVEAIIREYLSHNSDEIGVYAVGGDGNAVKVHIGHGINPSVQFKSICIIDGDSKQSDSSDKKIYRLPGDSPELHVYKVVKDNLVEYAAQLSVACHINPDKQEQVINCVNEIWCTNRDPHLLFSQVGIKLGFISERIISSAFLSIWLRQCKDEALKIADSILSRLK